MKFSLNLPWLSDAFVNDGSYDFIKVQGLVNNVVFGFYMLVINVVFCFCVVLKICFSIFL